MARFHNIYLGICVSNVDPLGRSRLQVKIPAILGEMTTWARGRVALLKTHRDRGTALSTLKAVENARRRCTLSTAAERQKRNGKC